MELLLAQPEAAILYGNARYWHSWTGRPEDQARDYLPRLGVPPHTLVRPPHLLTKYVRGTAAVACPSATLMRRDAVLRVGGHEESVRTAYDDQAFFAKLMLTAPVYVADACWVLYRQHPGSMVATAEQGGRSRDQRAAYLEWLERYVAGAGVRSPELRRALAVARWRVRHLAVDRAMRRVRRLTHQLRSRIARHLPRAGAPDS